MLLLVLAIVKLVRCTVRGHLVVVLQVLNVLLQRLDVGAWV